MRAFNDYKVSRQRRQENLTAYVEQRVAPGGFGRIALTNGWLFGWRHPGVEVISSLPADGGTLRVLERAAWFERVNAAEADPPLRVYRRVR